MHDFLQFLLFVTGWVILQRLVFPRLGVSS
jgi:hypothetical protein